MDTNTIKAALHERIDEINDDRILEAVYTLLENKRNEASGYELTDEQLNMIEDRDAKYIRGEMKTQSLDEFKMEMKGKFGYGV
jgi:hypothetical protein